MNQPTDADNARMFLMMTDAEVIAIVQARIDGKEIQEQFIDPPNPWVRFHWPWNFSLKRYRAIPTPQDEDEAAFEKLKTRFEPDKEQLIALETGWYAGLSHARQQKIIDAPIEFMGRPISFWNRLLAEYEQKGGDAICTPAHLEGKRTGAAQSDPESAPKREEIWVHTNKQGYNFVMQSVFKGDGCRLFREVLPDPKGE